jgi:hypothetical protein
MIKRNFFNKFFLWEFFKKKKNGDKEYKKNVLYLMIFSSKIDYKR